MKRLFIIGNGFDIAHNLPTKYADFKKFLEKTDIKLFNKIFEIYKYSLYIKVKWCIILNII